MSTAADPLIHAALSLTLPTEPLEAALLDVLVGRCRGRDRAHFTDTVRDLVRHSWRVQHMRKDAVGLPAVGDSALRIAKEHLMELGHPICSTVEHGWWYARTAAEVSQCVAMYREKALDMMTKAKRLEQAADRMFGPQQELVL